MTISTAIDPAARARALAVQVAYRDLKAGAVNFLPIRIGILGQGASATSYATTKRQIYSAYEAGSVYGFGSPIHLAALQLLPPNGDGVGTIPVTVYPLEDDVAGAAAAGDATPSVTTAVASTYKLVVNNIVSQAFSVADGDAVADIVAAGVAAINATPEMPVIASDGTTKIDLTAKWDGASGNDIYVELHEDSPTDKGVTWAFTQPTGGATNPSVTDALAQLGDVWETFILNCMEYDDTDTMDALQTVNEGRWGASVGKPFISFSGMTESTVALGITAPDARKTDRTNAYLTSVASNDLPLVVAARQLARIAKIAGANPPNDYGRQQATGLTPAADGSQWTAAQRESAFQGGCSTQSVKDGVVQIEDVITFYHPTGDTDPAYRYVVDQVKLWNVMYNTWNIFSASDWAAAPLIPDDQPTVNPTAKKPRMAKAAVSRMIDSLGLNAIISDPESAKESIIAGINDSNPKRLDVTFSVALSGNTNQKSIDLYFGFYYGTAPVVG